APPLFSTTKGLPNFSLRCWPMMRASWSVVPPGAAAAISFTGFTGQGSAANAVGDAKHAPNSTNDMKLRTAKSPHCRVAWARDLLHRSQRRHHFLCKQLLVLRGKLIGQRTELEHRDEVSQPGLS